MWNYIRVFPIVQTLKRYHAICYRNYANVSSAARGLPHVPPSILSQLAPAPKSSRPRKRLGRGLASGRGKRCGRGVKGQKSRSGHGIPRGFEGGQTPLWQRFPKLKKNPDVQ